MIDLIRERELAEKQDFVGRRSTDDAVDESEAHTLEASRGDVT